MIMQGSTWHQLYITDYITCHAYHLDSRANFFFVILSYVINFVNGVNLSIFN